VKRLLFWLLVGAVALPVIVLVGVVVALAVGFDVDLDPLRSRFEAAATASLGREVRFEGPLLLVPSFSPTVEVGGLHIANPTNWPTPDFARMQRARLQVEVLPFLTSTRLQIRELSAEGVEVALHRRKGGEVNWRFTAPVQAAPPEAEEPSAEPARPEADAWHEDPIVTAAELERILLTDIRVVYQNDATGGSVAFALDELAGGAATDAPLEIAMRGSYRKQPYRMSVNGGNPMDLLTGETAWPFEISLEIAETELRLSALVDEGERDFAGALDGRGEAGALEGRRLGEIGISLGGERLDSLDELVGLSLPPLGPHAFEGRFRAFAGGRYQADVEIGVGSSELRGTLELEAQRDPPRVVLDLVSEDVQLDDFRLGDWSPFRGEPRAAPAAQERAELSAPLEPRALLSPEMMRSLDARLGVRVKRVRSGTDAMGRAEFSAALEAGRFSLDPFQLEVPGGSVRLATSIQPVGRGVEATLTTRVDRFDYGILARRADPDTEMGGLFALDVRLRSRAPDAATLMRYASGRFDFAVFPEAFEAGIADLWAVNLLSAVLPTLDKSKESKVNCAVGLFNMKDGRMWQETILVDTSKMSVSGTAEVDFKTERIDVTLEPAPKRPEFFSLATPLQVQGSFEDFGVEVEPEDLFGTVLRFVTSVVHVPVQRIFTRKRPADDLEGCLAAMRRPEGR
jgi:uncharacterized protein involved in outer membrane biogenesis